MLCPKCHRDIPDDAVLCCYCGRTFQPRQAHRKRANGEGYVYRRGSTWTVCVTVDWTPLPNGKLRRIRRTKGGFSTRAEASAYASTLRAQLIGDKKKAPSLGHYWALYERDDLPKLSDSKITAYRIAWKRLQPLSTRAVDTLSVIDLRRVVSESASTYYPARDCKQLLVHLFRLAGADGWVSKDLPSYIILPERNETERKPFTDIEQAKLWKVWEAGDRHAAIPLIMIYTGMMPGELMDLRPEMIDLDDRKILGAGKKTKVRRESPVYIPANIIPILMTCMDEAQGGYIVPHSEKRFYADYYAALEAAGTRRLEPYCCRHTTATALAIDRQIAPQTVQRIMRWSSTRMLDRYAHPDDAAILTALDS